MEGLALYESRICECGMHESEADEDPDLELDFRVCPVCAGVARSMRVQHVLDENSDNPDATKVDKAAKVLPDDGRHVRIKRKPLPQE